MNAKKWLVVVGLMIVNVFVWYAVSAENRGGELTITFLDVGQGDATLIDGPNGVQVLIDGGRGREVLAKLSEAMPFYDRSIDVVISTHPDADHIGGLPFIFERYEVLAYIAPDITSESDTYKELTGAVDKSGVQELTASAGQVIDLGNGASLTILFPDVDVGEFESNTASVIALINYGDTEFLLTGDSPKGIERYMVSRFGENLDVDVLKVGHHGSKTSSDEMFVGQTSPEIAVISSGADNRYGHPHEEVLSIYERFEVETLNTASAGSITFTTNGFDLQRN